ncbi:MAG: tyrosine-type recombinase/integrase [Verrucomicrobiia bacterium]
MRKKRIPLNLPAVVGDYLESLRVRHYAPDTIYSREGELRHFWIYLQSIGVSEFREVSQRLLEDYHRESLERLADSTASLNLDILRSFFEYLENLGVILLNPCLWLPKPRLKKRLPRQILKPSEVRALLNAPAQTLKGIRDKAMLEVFYSSAIRRAEMAHLTLTDVDIQNGFVRVNKGKGGKDRVVPIGQSACAAVARYLKEVRSVWLADRRAPRTDALWLDSQHPHQALCDEAITCLVRQYARRVLGRNAGPHAWRHSCATHLVANGANIVYVQRLLGHKSLETTQIYTRVSVPDLKKTVQRAHPRIRRAVTPPPALTKAAAAQMPGGNRRA